MADILRSERGCEEAIATSERSAHSIYSNEDAIFL